MEVQKLVITADGTHTLFVPELDEHYHSVHGALQESMHVFINAGLIEAEKRFDTINLLEVGFGTGLNCLLTYFNHHKPVNYVGVEAFPVEESILGKLNYHEWLHYRDSQNVFRTIHDAGWNKPVLLNPDFQLNKLNSKIQDLHAAHVSIYQSCNLIYFDAFAPSAQPELWTKEIFEKMYSLLAPNGILVTYCAKGEVKRNMKAAGFSIEALPGPKGKREMTRAVKQ
jgi:tRNA U34 5-methylaminomethyl-2-thiouridine-forming methyltransferase MnmC